MIKTTCLLITIILSASMHTLAQQDQDAETIKKRMTDSVKAVYVDEAALLYPRIRQFTITHQDNLIGNIRSKIYGKEAFEGRFKSSRTTINMNVPVITDEKNTFVTSIGVVHQFFDLHQIANYDPQHIISDQDTYIPMISLGLTYSRRDSLWGRSFSITGSLNGLFNPSFSRRQFSFTGLITTPLIHNDNTNLIGGLVVSLDPSSPVPAFLFLSYFHKFRSLDIDLMADLPYRVALRKPVLKKASVTAFSELAGNNSFFKLEKPSSYIPEDLTFSTLEIKSGIMFEYRVTRKAVLSISSGVNATATSKIREAGERPKNYLIKNNNSPVPFVQVGISLLPFWQPFKNILK